MLRIFQQSNPLTLLLLILFTALINLKWILHPVDISLQEYSFIGNIVFNNWLHTATWPSSIVVVIHIALVLFTGVLLCFLMQQYKIITKASLIPAVVFISLCSFFPDFFYSTPEIICGIILVFILFKIFGVYNKSKADMTYFDVGLLSGVLSLIYFPSSVFCLFGILSLFRIRSTSFREFFIYMTGLILSYFLACTALFWFDLLPEFAAKQFHIPQSLQPASGAFGVITIVKISLIGAAFVTALVFFGNRFSTNLIQVRKYLSAFVWLFIFSTACLFLNIPLHEGALYFEMIAVSVFISYYFYHSKNKLAPELIYLGLVGATLLFQYINFA
ncbi:MAG: hypothetical protein IPL12_18220 [Bacteroidetes bacterium]|nr:hypothetical protein [Bacteroidota bacterium]MBK8345042.1 hypothetical protein [Bacteroidota bacterium]